jgi:hypothetical protein
MYPQLLKSLFSLIDFLIPNLLLFNLFNRFNPTHLKLFHLNFHYNFLVPVHFIFSFNFNFL